METTKESNFTYPSKLIFHQYIFHLLRFSLWAVTFLVPWFGKWHSSQTAKIVFSHLKRNLFAHVTVISFVSLNFWCTPWQFIHGSCIFMQSNKWTTWKPLQYVHCTLIESALATSLSFQRPCCFNNVILRNIRHAVAIQNCFFKSSPFDSSMKETSVWAREKTIETVDWHPQKLRFQQREGKDAC